jgi:hypothetical protein
MFCNHNIGLWDRWLLYAIQCCAFWLQDFSYALLRVLCACAWSPVSCEALGSQNTDSKQAEQIAETVTIVLQAAVFWWWLMMLHCMGTEYWCCCGSSSSGERYGASQQCKVAMHRTIHTVRLLLLLLLTDTLSEVAAVIQRQ